MKRCSRLPLAALTAVALSGGGAAAQSPCGDAAVVERGDTLTRIAERCDISEGRLLRANPAIEGSEDLRVGMRLDLRPRERQVRERVESFAERAGDRLAGFARDIGSSVDDLLDKNPDLQQRLRGLGDRLNIPGVDASKAKVSLSAQSGPVGTSVTISGTGLPDNVPVVIGAGPPRAAYDVLTRARTSADGTLQATVEVPSWAGEHRRLVFVVASDERGWTARSVPFEVTGGKP